MNDDRNASDFSGVHRNPSDPDGQAEFGPSPSEAAQESPDSGVNLPPLFSVSPGTVRFLAGDSGVHAEPPALGVHPENLLDPDQQINRALAQHQASLSDWTLLGTFNLVPRLAQCLDWYRLFRADGLLPSVWKEVPLKLPEHIRLTFDPRPANQLGTYKFGRAVGDGTRWNINLNPVSILMYRRSSAQTAAVFCHELHHLCEDQYLQQVGKYPTGSYHTAEFRRRVAELGIPCTRDGRELPMDAGSPFDRWLERHGIPRVFDYLPEERRPEAEPDPQQQPDAVSPNLPKRIVWRCGCENAVSVMVPRASQIHFVCLDCSQVVRPVDPDGLRR